MDEEICGARRDTCLILVLNYPEAPAAYCSRGQCSAWRWDGAGADPKTGDPGQGHCLIVEVLRPCHPEATGSGGALDVVRSGR